MNIKVNTRYEELCLLIKVQTLLPVKIRIKVFDFSKPKTIFTDRYKTVKGIQTFFIRMPLSSENIVISVFNEAKGNMPKNQDSTFSVVSIDKVPLEKRTDIKDINDIATRSFVDFAQRFSFNASYLEDKKTYQSGDGKYLIEYVPEIISAKTGRTLKTPARISKMNGRIQVSKQLFMDYTVPMRMAILLHEYSHFYKNGNMDDEIEADLNGLLVYLALGYPRIEGYNAFLEVFMETPSMQNKNRYDIINKFITDFENNKMVIKH